MAATAAPPASSPRRARWAGVALAGLVLLAAGAAGGLTAAWGYALFLLAGALLAASLGAWAVLLFTRRGETGALVRAGSLGLQAGIAAYVLAVFALGGFFAHETLAGRMEWHWILFGPAALAALLILDVGLYRKLVRNNLPTWERYRMFIRREDADPQAMRTTFVEDVVVQRRLWEASRVRWIRHALIFWGFAGMFALELAAVVLREAVPAFGWRDVWREPGHPLRLAFDFGFDATGLMVLAGCLLALAWRVAVRGKPERKYADTPTTLFLLAVVASGFVVEGMRIGAAAGEPAHAASFVGVVFAKAQGAVGIAPALERPLWLLHVLGACVLIAYVPLKRMVHTCATPIGRLMNSQRGLLAAKKRGVIARMLRGGASGAADA